ncbi:hypothetical protein F2P81_021118 [Scophthalmus maximus]|uniref:Uncharacterized protein n=1 Tax=Scophthalmus maximus TaxID=52904 RepID=A0A6A4S5G5_SCOMX|nr:hypothetical protein F2P81_021118 [Scophthalmus maximus]
MERRSFFLMGNGYNQTCQCYPVAPEMPSPVVTCDDDAGEVSSSAARGSDTISVQCLLYRQKRMRLSSDVICVERQCAAQWCFNGNVRCSCGVT